MTVRAAARQIAALMILPAAAAAAPRATARRRSAPHTPTRRRRSAAPWRQREYSGRNARRGVLKECRQAVQQARPRGRELRWRVAWEVRKRVKRIDGVPEVREEEGHPMVAGAAADLGYERMARRTGVELGDKIDRRL